MRYFQLSVKRAESFSLFGFGAARQKFRGGSGSLARPLATASTVESLRRRGTGADEARPAMEPSFTCPNCRQAVHTDDKFCRACAHNLS